MSPKVSFRSSSAPADSSIALVFTGGGLHKPQALAIDGNGNDWIATSALELRLVLRYLAFRRLGSLPCFTAGNLSRGRAITVDPGNDIWVVSQDNAALDKFDSNGDRIAGAICTNGLSGPRGVASDGNGHIWATDSAGGTVSVFNSSAAVGDYSSSLAWPFL